MDGKVGGKRRATNCDMATLFAITFGDKIRLGWCCWVYAKSAIEIWWDSWVWRDDSEPEHWHYKSTLLSWESVVELGGFFFITKRNVLGTFLSFLIRWDDM